MTEDAVRDQAKEILGLDNIDNAEIKQGTGQITTFNQLGFRGIKDKPDGWYIPANVNLPAIILETKSSEIDIHSQKCIDELLKNCDIVAQKNQHVIGILYNGEDILVYVDKQEQTDLSQSLESKQYYLDILSSKPINKNQIYLLTKSINNCLHFKFGLNNLNHRMIFTACALVAERYGANLRQVKDMGYDTFHARVRDIIKRQLPSDNTNQENKLSENQEAINQFIDDVCGISSNIHSNQWRGEDVMGIFFNEFNRYKKKSESGQVFTPDHITSFMYRLINVSMNDRVLDAACGSGAFLVKAMSNMMQEAGGVNTKKAKKIKTEQLYGIEFYREIFALACANMLIHKDGKTNLTQMDTRTNDAAAWIASKNITKVLMNPPFEKKYGCLEIVLNVLNNVPAHTACAFILPDKKLEKDKGNGKKILKSHTLKKIIKLPEKTFLEGVTTSIFIFEAKVPHGDKDIFACFVPEDGLETVKNQGRQDIRDNWHAIEDRWVDVIQKQSGDESIQWINPHEHLSYQMPEKPFELFEEDFTKTIIDYMMFEKGIDAKEFSDGLIKQILYSSSVEEDQYCVTIKKSNNE